MKKIILLFFILSLISFGSPKYDFRFKDVDILQIKIGRKSNGRRSLSGIVNNKSSKQIDYVKFDIKLKDEKIPLNNNYCIVGEVKAYNLSPYKKINFKTHLKVLDMDGRDLKVEITDLVVSQK